jgi:hypothetical protein
MNKALATLAIFILFINCGFQPIYKISDDGLNTESYSVEIINKVPREIFDEINANTLSNDSQEYKALLKISEGLTPLIINTNGTVAKYRIEITIDYELLKTDINEVLSAGTTRGFAQYDVVESELTNEDNRRTMLKIATKNAYQIMASKIQSSISK